MLVVTVKEMERSNIRDFDDLVKIAPSVTITKTSQPGNNSINIRGIGTYAYSIATEPSVAVVIDEIPQAFQAAAFAALVDVQQIEVLRGPQNTLFGKSASAGVISITTQPATDEFTGRADRHGHRRWRAPRVRHDLRPDLRHLQIPAGGKFQRVPRQCPQHQHRQLAERTGGHHVARQARLGADQRLDDHAVAVLHEDRRVLLRARRVFREPGFNDGRRGHWTVRAFRCRPFLPGSRPDPRTR